MLFAAVHEPALGTNVEWVGTIGAGPLLGVKRKHAYAPRQSGFSSALDPERPKAPGAQPKPVPATVGQSRSAT